MRPLNVCALVAAEGMGGERARSRWREFEFIWLCSAWLADPSPKATPSRTTVRLHGHSAPGGNSTMLHDASEQVPMHAHPFSNDAVCGATIPRDGCPALLHVLPSAPRTTIYGRAICRPWNLLAYRPRTANRPPDDSLHRFKNLAPAPCSASTTEF